MPLKDESTNDLYYRLWKLRAHSEYLTEEEYEIIEELKRREGERER